ncbi:MAG: glycoside hydrolase family 2 TIM barrel-domain containing protein [Rikenellaceae bacterium]
MKKSILMLSLLAVGQLAMASTTPPLLEWQDNQVTGVNREEGRATFWYYETEDEALSGGYYNCETNQSLNGEWKFSFATNPDEREADFYKTSYDVSAWDDIKVPGSWPLQGYDRPVYLNHPYEFALQNPYPCVAPTAWNPVGSYRRDFTISKEWKNQRVVLYFGAVKSAFYVWVNGKKVGYSQDSKMQAEFDITPYIKEGNNTLAVEVYRFSIGSYLECQDFWRLAGIKRDVWLYATPKTFIKDVKVSSPMINDYKDGELTVEVELAALSGSSTQNVDVELFDAEGNSIYKGSKSAKVSKSKGAIVTLNNLFPGIEPWSAESPNLYTLVVSNGAKGKDKSYMSTKVGFRTVELRNSQLQVNGKPIYVRGVNRHEHHPELGHFVPRETVEKDVELMKKLNINSVRTCHYPADPYFYELCDKYGLYICDEANVESHGLGAAVQAPYDPAKHIADDASWIKIHHNRMERMVQRDKNHPSVIIWSMGNECGDGVVFREGYKMLKEMDPSRLVQFEQAATQPHTDVYAPMYMRMDKVKNYAISNDSYRPLILCEYVHAMGNSLGNFQDYWDLFETYPLLQGGFIWDWVDQAVVDYRDGERFLDYGGAYGYQNERNDGAFCLNGVINADRELNPHAYEAKKVLQALRVKPVVGSDNEFELFNNFSFTNASKYAQSWTLEKNGVAVESGVLNLTTCPLRSERFTVNYTTKLTCDADYYITFNFDTKDVEGYLPKGYTVAYDQLALREFKKRNYESVSEGELDVEENDSEVVISSGDFSVKFSTESGALSGLTLGGFEYVESAMRPDFWRVKVDNDGWSDGEKYWKNAHKHTTLEDFEIVENRDGDKIVSVAVIATTLIDIDPKNLTADLQKAYFNTTYTIYPDATIEVMNNFLPTYYHAERDMSLPRIGQLIALSGKLSEAEWYGRGPWENYSDRKTSALVGRYSMPVSEMMYNYTRPQENGYRTDVREFALTSKDGYGIEIEGLPRIGINAQNISKESYESSRNTVDLNKEDKVYLNIDLAQMGVGGDNSWGNPVHVDYRVLMRNYNYGYVIKLTKE